MKITDIIKTLGYHFSLNLTNPASNPSEITIQLRDGAGDPVALQYYLLCRLSAATQYAPSGVLDSELDMSTAVEQIEQNVGVWQSDAAGLVRVEVVHSGGDNLCLRVGPPPAGALRADYTASIVFVGPGGGGGT